LVQRSKRYRVAAWAEAKRQTSTQQPGRALASMVRELIIRDAINYITGKDGGIVLERFMSHFPFLDKRKILELSHR
jgi:hypothetical protein